MGLNIFDMAPIPDSLVSSALDRSADRDRRRQACREGFLDDLRAVGLNGEYSSFRGVVHVRRQGRWICEISVADVYAINTETEASALVAWCVDRAKDIADRTAAPQVADTYAYTSNNTGEKIIDFFAAISPPVIPNSVLAAYGIEGSTRPRPTRAAPRVAEVPAKRAPAVLDGEEAI